jgi:4-amino-4-deoxychorismate lyase
MTQLPTSTRTAKVTVVKDRPYRAVFFCLKVLFNRPMQNDDELPVNILVGQGAEDELQIPCSDRGLAYGHGVFESMLVSNDLILLEDRHLDRLMVGAQSLGITVTRAKIASSLHKFLGELKLNNTINCVMKVILTAGSGGRGYKNPGTLTPRLIITHTPVPSDLAEQKALGINLWRCNCQLSINRQLAGIKHLNRLEQVLARNEPHRSDCADGLMFDSSGCLIETTVANVFLKTSSSGWITPSIVTAGVAGVMRSLLIDMIFPRLNIPLAVKTIQEVVLTETNEIFVCNSIRGLLPVTGVADRDGVMTHYPIGDTTRDLQAMLGRLYPCFQ